MPIWLLILVCVVCWASWSLVIKLASSSVSPLMIQVIVAYVQSALAPVLFMYMKATNVATDWNPKGMILATTACLLSMTAGLSFSTALQKAPVHIVVGFASVYPALTFVLAAIFLGESVTVVKAMGILTIVVGTVMLSW